MNRTPLHHVLPPRLQELQLQYPVGKRPGSRGHDVWTTDQPLVVRRLTLLAENKLAFLPDLTLVVVWRQGRDEDGSEADADAAAGGVVRQLDMLQGLFGSVGTVFDLCVGTYIFGINLSLFGRKIESHTPSLSTLPKAFSLVLNHILSRPLSCSSQRLLMLRNLFPSSMFQPLIKRY